ncbi:MAG: tRNA pseudouridine(13) synthase TruD [Candidatus Woesearchaeota archaeon]|nr:tRNA pseudouridine(13) synthase TruD [Candidatus Woesearchaeota archaeon]
MAESSQDYEIKRRPEDFIVKEVSSIKPKENGEYAYFLLKKRDYTTIKAIDKIARFLKIPLKEIGFAGTKDKIAVTEQYISIRDPLRKFEERMKLFNIKDISVSFIGRGDSPISLGDLKGNKFEIIAYSEKKPKKIGRFVNYFGEQRFSKNNIEIGKRIIKNELKEAAALIDNQKVKEYLKNHPNDFANALRQLPQKILILYIHSYQSYLWNRAAEELLKKVNNIEEDIEIDVLGFGTEFKEKKVREVYERIMKKEGISQRDFIIRNLPDLSSEGDKRKLFERPIDLDIKEVEKGKHKIKFFLPKGCYATELIRQMFS